MKLAGQIVLISMFFLSACKKEQATSFEEQAPYKELKTTEVATDKVLPLIMWDQIVGEEEGNTSRSSRFLPVTIFLREKTAGVLGNENYKIVLGHGGGESDLSLLVRPDAGTFILGFKLDTEESLDDLQVFFLSRTKKRSFDAQIFGGGCSSFYDITTYAKAHLFQGGMEVNTNRKRHVTLLGGTFVFSLKKEGYHYLSQVSFVDPQSEALFCDPLLSTSE